VLVVLDRPIVVQLIKLTLMHGMYTTRATTIAPEIATALTDWQPHVVILDMDMDGLHLMERIAANATMLARVPVLAVTRRGDLRTNLAALEAGVDDVLTIPFGPEELLARVIVILRRSYGGAVTLTPVIKVGELELDIFKRTVRVGSSELHLTSLEQNLLYLLAANAGQVVTREEILDTLWGTDFVADDAFVDRQIRNLRARLQHDRPKPPLIATVPGRGYRFVPGV
jgi:DNA-binding response OmpR family regulator